MSISNDEDVKSLLKNADAIGQETGHSVANVLRAYKVIQLAINQHTKNPLASVLDGMLRPKKQKETEPNTCPSCKTPKAIIDETEK